VNLPIEFVMGKWDHECCGHPFLRVEDRFGGRTAPTRGQCDCRCHEKDIKEARRQLLTSAPKLYATLDRVRMLVESGALMQRPGLSEPVLEELHDLGPTLLVALREARGETGGAS